MRAAYGWRRERARIGKRFRRFQAAYLPFPLFGDWFVGFSEMLLSDAMFRTAPSSGR
jgi:hypothetical protein